MATQPLIDSGSNQSLRQDYETCLHSFKLVGEPGAQIMVPLVQPKIKLPRRRQQHSVDAYGWSVLTPSTMRSAADMGNGSASSAQLPRLERAIEPAFLNEHGSYQHSSCISPTAIASLNTMEDSTVIGELQSVTPTTMLTNTSPSSPDVLYSGAFSLSPAVVPLFQAPQTSPFRIVVGNDAPPPSLMGLGRQLPFDDTPSMQEHMLLFDVMSGALPGFPGISLDVFDATPTVPGVPPYAEGSLALIVDGIPSDRVALSGATFSNLDEFLPPYERPLPNTDMDALESLFVDAARSSNNGYRLNH